MKKLLYILCQWTWGLPQNLVGLGFFLFYRCKGCRSFSYQGARVTIWTQRSGSMSMGRYLFMEPSWTPSDHRLLAHEYGHTIQSLFFGPSICRPWACRPCSGQGSPAFGICAAPGNAAITPSTRKKAPPVWENALPSSPRPDAPYGSAGY